MRKLSDILRAGKANIEQRGWCQGDDLAIFGPEDGPCCVATAITRQGQLFEPFEDGVGGTRYRDRGWDAVELFKKANGLDVNQGVAQWNDALERTKAEVLAGYDKAIAAAEAQERT